MTPASLSITNVSKLNVTPVEESTFHQLSPYIGKIKSSIANHIIKNYTKTGDLILDPFCGAGTIPFEAWSLKRSIIANDLNLYAYTVTMAKLNPPKSLNFTLKLIEHYSTEIEKEKKRVDLRRTPKWVRSFFHNETLRELIAWFNLLKNDNQYFLQACLLGILHHQRPGFLSYPSSHTVPYLRTSKFPQSEYPTLYEYRNVKERLIKKATRAFSKTPKLDRRISRTCHNTDAKNLLIKNKVDAIITSPPYMRQLDYARDNRLRLWFLGVENIRELDTVISPKESDFINMIKTCAEIWKVMLKKNGRCILFVGDNYSNKFQMHLPEIIENIFTKEGKGFKLLCKHFSKIPTNRRVRRNYKGNVSETLLVFEKI